MFQLLSYNVWVQILCKLKLDKQIPWPRNIHKAETFVLHLGERAFQPKSPVKTSLLIEEHLQLALCLTQPMSGTLVGGLFRRRIGCCSEYLWRSKRNHHHSCPSFRDLLQGGLQRGNVLASRTLEEIIWENRVIFHVIRKALYSKVSPKKLGVPN